MLVQERDKPARMRSPHRPGHEPPPQRLPEPPQPLGLLTGGAAPQRAVRQYPRRFRPGRDVHGALEEIDRKSTRLNSSHLGISYAVFCLKKKKKTKKEVKKRKKKKKNKKNIY